MERVSGTPVGKLNPYRARVVVLLAVLLLGGTAIKAPPTKAALPLSRPLHLDSGSSDPPEWVVIRLYVNDQEHLDVVAGQLDIWETHPEDKVVIAAVTPAQVRWLRSQGYRVEIDSGKTALLSAAVSLDPRYYYFDDYYTNANGRYVVDFLEDVNAAYPDLTELIDIGDAWESDHGGHPRDIWVLRVTNEDPAYGPVEDKPAFFLFATIHAREVAVPELAIRYIKYLTEGYDGGGGYAQDPDVTWLVNYHVAYVLVMQNPDGHWKNEQDTGYYRRKNLDSDDGCSVPSWWGVDLNRNHSFLWGCCGGSSGDPCDHTYRGPARGSEPETQAFESYFATVMRDQNGPNGDDEIPPTAPINTTGLFISLHTYGDLILWPWGFDDYGDSPNATQLRAIGRKFAYYTGYDPSATVWYYIDGATDDWTYGKFGIPSFTFEVGPDSGGCAGFFPPYGCIDGIDGMPRDFWAENLPAFLFAHKIARTPYVTAYGPDAQDLHVTSDEGTLGLRVNLAAVVADHRYPGDSKRPIAAAEYFLGAPGQDGAGIPMEPMDGAWGGLSEVVTATVSAGSLDLSQNILLVHGQSDLGDWGPFTAVFVQTEMYDVYLPSILRG
jgi:carboxypeptidase T